MFTSVSFSSCTVQIDPHWRHRRCFSWKRPATTVTKGLKVQPEVFPAVLGLQSEVQIEAVDVGGDADHGHPSGDRCVPWGILRAYPARVSSPGPTALLAGPSLFALGFVARGLARLGGCQRWRNGRHRASAISRAKSVDNRACAAAQ